MDSKWKPVDRQTLAIGYEEAAINFTCPCGNEIYVDDEPVTCADCGRSWRYVTQLQVKQDGAQA